MIPEIAVQDTGGTLQERDAAARAVAREQHALLEKLIIDTDPAINVIVAVANLTEEILARREIPEWCHNAGGYGIVSWLCPPEGEPTIKVDMYVRITDIEESSLTFDRRGQPI